jgi:3'(2'), 5'-bisphosphate nucleotidase
VRSEGKEIMMKEALSVAIRASLQAGSAIIDIYESADDLEIQKKDDDSPLTRADRAAHDVISNILMEASSSVTPHLLSEEGKSIPYEERKNWEYFWLVDPLDGTKEFINRNGEFTVNIALIHKDTPVVGVVYVPVKQTLYFAAEGVGGYKIENSEKVKSEAVKRGDFPIDEIISNSEKLPVSSKHSTAHSSPLTSHSITIIASRSHMNEETTQFIDDMKKRYEHVELVSAGSSLKLCMVAEGTADIYPRLGPTMEWDTAAAHAVVQCAGARIYTYPGQDRLVYNKQDLLNPYFVVSGLS